MATDKPKVTALGFHFNAREVAPQAAPEPFPAGFHPTWIIGADVGQNDGGQGKRIAFEFEIFEGTYKGRKAFDGLNVVHSNPDTQRIAAAQFSAICHATGVYDVTDMTQLFRKPFLAKFDIEPARTVNEDNEAVEPGTPNSKSYEAKNRYRGCKPYVAAVAGAAAAPTAPGGVPGWAVTEGAGAIAPTAPAATAPAAAPVATAPTTPKKPGGKKPGGKPAAATTPPPPERNFFVNLDTLPDSVPESKLREFFAKGMPAATLICLEGEETFKTAAEYGITSAPAAATPPAVVPPPATVPAVGAAPAALAGGVPAWAQ